METQFDIIIIGAGLVGLTAALACAHKGANVALLDAASPEAIEDERASAIAASSYAMFEHLGIVPLIKNHVQPITDMLIADGTVGDVSPLTLHFDSADMDGPTGYMVENKVLRGALVSQVKSRKNIKLIAPVNIQDVNRRPKSAMVTVEGQAPLTASLIVAADGRHSNLRRDAAIDVQRFVYDQKAIVTTVSHELPHDGVAHQIFFPGGPLALLPLTRQRCSIVWSDTARAIDAAMALDEASFTAELARRIGGFLGDIKLAGPRQAFPLSLQMAEQYTAERLVLIGDAAHAIHPIAGQGLNMGLRDAAALADVIETSLETGLDIGGAAIGDYEEWRNFDNKMLGLTTDLLTRLFSNNVTPLRHARRLGLAAVNRFKPAQAFFMKEAAGQSGDLPSLLRR